MPLISYAYNAEDVVLHRVFADQPTGFYIDVGAADPARHSATKIFYDAGWRGVNVAFNAEDQAALAIAQPRDVNLWAAPDEPLPDMPVTDRVIDFLKIVGPNPASALAALSHLRPRLLLIEAVNAAGAPKHQSWEPQLLAAGYRFGLFDGVHRFYVRAGDAALSAGLASPANVLDYWRPAREAAAAARIAALTASATALRAQHGDYVRATLIQQRAAEVALREAQAARDAARQEAHLVHVRLRDADAALRARKAALAALPVLQRQLVEQRDALARLTASRSWRLTTPLRDAVRLAMLVRPGG